MTATCSAWTARSPGIASRRRALLRGLVSSQNANREWLYYTQQTVSAEGFSGQAFQHVRAAHGARSRKRRSAPIATSPPRATTTPGWSSCCCRARIFSISWDAMSTWRRATRVSKPSRPPSTTSRRPSSAAICSAWPIPTIFASTSTRKRELTTAYHHGGNVLDIQLARRVSLRGDRHGRLPRLTTSPTSTTRAFPSAW